MPDLRAILMIVGMLISTLGCTMMLPALYELAIGNTDWLVFAGSSGITLFVGVLLTVANRTNATGLSTKQAFLLTTLSWIMLTAFSALPFVWSGQGVSYTDAFFEAMSGLTTTGATIYTDLDHAPPGLLLWRALLHWLGGIGIIVMAIAVLPMLQVGGMQLFRMESSDTSEKILPRATQIAGSITLLYLMLTMFCVLGYMIAGMTPFDAVAHAMATIATGGFSTHDSSIGFYDDVNIEMVAVVFMILGSLPFVLMLQVFRGHYNQFFGDAQVRLFLAIIFVAVFLAWGAQGGGGHEVGPLELRDATFNVVSAITGTGFATRPYDTWSHFSAMLFLVLMFIGGCAGSASCGIKVFRFQILFAAIRQRVLTFTQPHRVVIPSFNGKPVSSNVSRAVMNFVFLYLLSFGVISGVLSLYDLDSLTALSATAGTLSNVGPGLGPIVGPSGTYQDLPDGVKWILSFAMLLGRLEILTVLVLFTPVFWRS